MIESMTGYGRHQQALSGYDITVEIKSVNHRYFECSTRAPRSYGYLEERLKAFIHEKVSRGKIDMYVTIMAEEASDTVVTINNALASSYLRELRAFGQSASLEDTLTLDSLTKFSDLFSVHRQSEDEEVMWGLVQTVASDALEQFLVMRRAEGAKMKEDILSRLNLLEGYTKTIEEQSPSIVEKWRERLFTRISALLDEKQVDETRLITEAAIFAEKTAVDEETVRLYSHLQQFRSILSQEDAIGRKLDFLVQEINREINTIGSKSQDADASKLVVEMKSEAEKIREQIQNIE